MATDKYELGDKVWYEAADGKRYLMVVKQIHGEHNYDLFPHDDTRLLLEDTSESKFRFVYSSDIRRATTITEGNRMMAKKVAEIAIERAASIAEAKGHALSYAQKNFLSQAIIQGFFEMKQEYGNLERNGFFERLT